MIRKHPHASARLRQSVMILANSTNWANRPEVKQQTAEMPWRFIDSWNGGWGGAGLWRRSLLLRPPLATGVQSFQIPVCVILPQEDTTFGLSIFRSPLPLPLPPLSLLIGSSIYYCYYHSIIFNWMIIIWK